MVRNSRLGWDCELSRDLVVTLAVSYAQQIEAGNADELGWEFGGGISLRYVLVHLMVKLVKR